jgi:hypothetical protein
LKRRYYGSNPPDVRDIKKWAIQFFLMI